MLRSKVARNPGDLASVLSLGAALYQAGDAKGSADILKAALADHPGHYPLLLLLARAKARSGDPDGAFACFAKAQQVRPEEPTGWRAAAALASELRNWSELLRIGRAWVQAQPGSAPAWQAQAQACFEESDFRQALACYERVLQLEPGKPEHFISVARMAIAARQYELARQHLERAAELDPDSDDLQFAFSRWHHLTGDLDSALACCERVLAMRTDHAPALV
jgi:tetratricopeptide (TPR) repeat protein